MRRLLGLPRPPGRHRLPRLPRLPRRRPDGAPAPPSRRAICGWLAAALATLVAAGAVAPGASSAAADDGPVPTAVRYRSPTPFPVRVVRPFVAPPQPWASGHRGVDLAADEGSTVLAPADGTVVVAGKVVDRGVVTIAHADGRRSSLEPVTAVVVAGRQVRAGDAVGTVSGERSHCATPCLHWGVRDGPTYVDPLTLLPGGGPVVLLPDDE